MATPKSSTYMGQLDGLRALAVAVVAWSHWRTYWLSKTWIPWGELGVETFFVISGFLITGILLDNRSGTSKFLVLKQFYIRRFLRIFPLFYATLLIALLWKASGMSQSWQWHFSYLSNIYFYFYGWQGQLSHFWSLAVEEQFYLCWPLLLIFLPARFLLPAILTSIVVAPIFEIIMTLFYSGHAPDVSASILMPSCMDALGIGALLSYSIRKEFPVRWLAWIFLFIGLLAYFVCRFSEALEPLGRMAEDCVLGWLVFSSAEGFRGSFGRLLASKPLNYLGKISYGLYVFHNFASSMCEEFLSCLGEPAWLMKLYNIPILRIFAFASLTIGLASYSWHRFEKPINNLKCKFPYPNRQPPPVNPPKINIPNPLP